MIYHGEESDMMREPYVADQFYPGNPAKLAASIDASMEPEAEKTDALLVLLPHAGYMYCGGVIAATLSRVRLPDRLILLGPNHTGRGEPLAVWPEGVWKTPLGAIPVDVELAAMLTTSEAGYSPDTIAHLREHSLEVLLPFLQRKLPGLQITPVCVSCRPQQLEAAGLALAKSLTALAQKGERAALIISSDMNHYATHSQTLKLDAMALKPFLELDPVSLFNTVASRGISMCGVLPATLGLFTCQALGARKTELVRHTTSGEVSGDMAQVVGYAGAYVACP